ncbi:cell wall-active antibiotics response protein LiaF [Sutcliffiella horikoshii]|uniref:Cell wall-active antibiotics response protein n=1 Tax=Sutcliffiella horikoshii TaxID=79883 RepID=A0AA94WSJ6_9BACI|nr:cell wall-active antibiotics response protein LiaF [Sutcliffiella horikoshii]TYS60271.1 cell wall-active antibiotics response protein [Sutcliffiella horikoshii]
MLNKMKSDYLSFIIVVASLIFLLEILFFNTGLIFSFLFSGFLIYVGWKKWHWLIGKALFVIGLLSITFTIFNMMTFNFLLLATVLYFLYKFLQAKKQPVVIQPNILPEREEQIVRNEQKWFTNKLFGRQKTPEQSYTWDDVNIQCGISDTEIDLSYTVLPKGEAIIYIRNVIGNIQILVPYELELSIVHSGMVGSIHILDKEEKSILNQTIHYQTENYKEATHKVKIVTSIFVGSIEVKRV